MYQKIHTKMPWADMDVTQVNREAPHSQWGAYATKEEAFTCDILKSSNVKSLNGNWKFRYYDEVPEYGAHLDKNFTAEIAVPGNWEYFGFGEPVYTNFTYPWRYYETEGCVVYPTDDGEFTVVNAPEIPKKNPTGIYETTFTVDEDWCKKDTFIQFDGVETSYILWVNDKEVGYAEDSKLPSTFDITKYVVPGENTLTVQVMKIASSSYLEDQDYWYLAGIYRPVYLISKPRKRIVDCKVLTDYERGKGSIRADILLNRVNGFANSTVTLEIFDGEKLIYSKTPEIGIESRHDDRIPDSNACIIREAVGDVEPWTPETPKLYTVICTLSDENGNVLDIESYRIGFKRVEIIKGVVHLNGQRMIVKGMNRHEHHVYTGRSLSREIIIREVENMKRMNINAVRTCHYPSCREFYELCDEYGLMVMLQCNVETHGVGGQLTRSPEWAAEFVNRAARMVTFYKNHASVYCWSLGNESGVGPAHAAMYGWVKEYDPTRLCQYEGGEILDISKRMSDTRPFMYAQQWMIRDMISDVDDDRPIILIEMLYQMLNAGSGVQRYVDCILKYPRFQGGFAWDLIDKGIATKDENGVEFYGYAGAFNESIRERECAPFFTNNGVMLGDYTWKPGAYELKMGYMPIIFRKPHYDHREITKFENRYLVSNTNMALDSSHYDVTATVYENGYPIKTVNVDLPLLKPGETIDWTYKVDYESKPNCKYHILFTVNAKEATKAYDKGYEIGYAQFELEHGKTERSFVPEVSSNYTVSEEGNNITVTDGSFTVVFSKDTGTVKTMVKDGTTYLMEGWKKQYYRPACGTNCPGMPWGRNVIWDEMRNPASNCLGVSYYQGSDGRVVVESENCTTGASGYKIYSKLTYTVLKDKIHVDVTYDMDKDIGDLPRIGEELVIPAGFETLKYFAYGRNEAYCDRMLSPVKAVYESEVEQEHFPFNPPVENGGHESCEWLEISDSDGHTMRFEGDLPFHFDIHHNTVEDYLTAGYEHRLKRRAESYLHIDAKHAGIGGEMVWISSLYPENRVNADKYLFGFSISVK